MNIIRKWWCEHVWGIIATGTYCETPIKPTRQGDVIIYYTVLQALPCAPGGRMKAKAFFEALGQRDAHYHTHMVSYLAVRRLYIWPQWAIRAYINAFCAARAAKELGK